MPQTPERKREYMHDYWHNRRTPAQKERKRERGREIIQERRAWYRTFKATLACEVCAENHPRCIEFHHKLPSSKNGEPHIADKLASWSIARIMEEVAKCAVLCANCHRKVHAAADELFGYDGQLAWIG